MGPVKELLLLVDRLCTLPSVDMLYAVNVAGHPEWIIATLTRNVTGTHPIVETATMLDNGDTANEWKAWSSGVGR